MSILLQTYCSNFYTIHQGMLNIQFNLLLTAYFLISVKISPVSLRFVLACGNFQGVFKGVNFSRQAVLRSSKAQ